MKKNSKNSKAKNIIRFLLLIICGAIIGFNVYFANANSLLGNKLPMPFGYGVSVVLSGSMEPALSVGDLLIVQEQDDYGVGDVVVYQSGTMPVVHRIVDISDEEVITRGDANNADDEPFPVATIKGEVISVVPMVGYLVSALKTPVAMVIILAAAVLLVEWSFRTEKLKKEEESEKIKAEIRALMEELRKD